MLNTNNIFFRGCNILVLFLLLLFVGIGEAWGVVEYHDYDGDGVDETYNVVYLKLNGATGKKDGSSGDDAVGTWANAYGKLPAYTGTIDADRDAAWDSNIIVVCDIQTQGSLFIDETVSGNRPATITGVWPWTAEKTKVDNIKNWGGVYLNASAHSSTLTSGTTRIGADTKFKYIRFCGATNFLSMYLHDCMFDVGCTMDDMTNTLTTANGAMSGRTSPDMQVFLFANAYNFTVNSSSKPDGGWPQQTKPVTLTIRSGKFGRILSNRIIGTKNDEIQKRYVIGNPDHPLMCVINVDIDEATTGSAWNTKGFTDDIAFLCAGMTQGAEYCDVEFNIRRGTIATLVGAMQGNSITNTPNVNLSNSSFFGRTKVTINPENDADVVIQRYFAGCFGRETGGQTGISNAAFYGQSILNMYGGTIESGAYVSAGGISGLKSADGAHHTTDKYIPYVDASANKYYPYMGITYKSYDATMSMPKVTTTLHGSAEVIDLEQTRTEFNIYGGIIKGGLYGGSYGFSPEMPTERTMSGAGSLWGETSVNIYGGTISGGVYGGGMGDPTYYNTAANNRKADFLTVASVYGDTNVNVYGGIINGGIYGGGKGIPYQAQHIEIKTVIGSSTYSNYTCPENEFLNIAKVYGNTNVTINPTDPEWTYDGNIYGGGALGSVEGSTNVTILGGTINGQVFGAGEGEDGHSNKAKVGGTDKTITVNVENGTISENVYGGGNLAIAEANPTINISGGAISENVYGGGYGAPAVLTGNPTINVTGGTITQDVYGGGALANVEGSTAINIDGGSVTQDVYGGGALANVSANTSVNLNGGSIRSSYGGGLGSTEVAPLIGGDATTTLNGSIVLGNVFGCNNLNGTPQGHAKVHVLGTTPRDGQGAEEYDVAAVYGGGNLAAYVPSDATLADNDKNFAEVLIENCDNNIEYVYGGGNAAPVPATKVTIVGANVIDNAFAGGNGAGADNLGADIGYKGFFSRGAATEYGTGIATINVQGGTIRHVYGGSNTLGYIKDHAVVNVEAKGTCPMDVAELYGGGKMAPGKAANINIACTGENGKIEEVFGGANQADVEGDITLNITGGNIGNIFGGNNQSGTINGAIAVNINWDSNDCGIKHIDNVYGGGNLAPYATPLGKAHPTITLTNGTVSNNIFGGGLGASAVMTGNPVVNIKGGAVGGSVYGGGEQADVVGSTYVTINDGRFGADIFGGGQGLLDGDGNVQESADVSGETHVTINGGEFAVEPQDVRDPINDKPFKYHYNIYGGGNIASEVGETHVYVTKGMVSNASAGGNDFLDNDNPNGIAYAYYREGQMYFCIFGGGYGKNTRVTGNTWVDFNISGMIDINSTAIEDDLLEYQSYLDVIGGGFNGTVGGNTNVHVGGNAMCRNVYGGGLYAAIGTEGQSTKGNTNVYITGGNIDNVYGGGVMGDIMTSTNVNIGLTADMTFDGHDHAKANDKVTILMSVYGANDVSGHVPQANVTHNGGTVDQNIYGAGNGDYRGYYTPNHCAYADGENDNYYIVNHAGDIVNSGPTYKGRPQTENVNITMGGNSDSDRAVVLGQVFGGGNSCTVGHWKTDLSSKYDGDPHKWRDDPEFFEGGGQLNITIGSHVKIGYDNTTLANASDDIKKMYIRNGDNVSGLYMGCSGDVLATQSLDPEDYDYHHYYDAKTKRYWPGFVVYKNEADHYEETEDRAVGLASFNAYLNNILMWTDNVNLTIANDATDIWLANFVGGGFRGSMKAKTESKKFKYTLPSGVTIGNAVVGGAYNTDVVYRIFETSDGHTYTETDGHYNFLTEVGSLTKYDKDTNPNGDYHHIEYAEDGETIKGIVRFNYEGGIISSDGESFSSDIAELDLGCNFDTDPETYVYGGCFTSGSIYGNTKIDYHASNADKVFGGGYGVEAIVKGNTQVNIKDGATTSYVFGGGAEAKVNKNTQVNITGGSVSTEVYGGGALANIEGNTELNLTGGSIGSAYGGGLGDANTPALVYGNATVTLNGSVVNGSIFGANNVNGTPKGHVKVHVLSTASRRQANRNTAGTAESFDVLAVYGGGNKAAYIPSDATFTANKGFAEVLIENCDNSIAYVYGGGNAAPVPATDVTIYGADAIDNAFAGGNGKTEAGQPDNPGADIGYLDYTRDDPAKEYGSGETHITIYGGTVNNVFGGSNTLGYIRTHAYVDIPEFPADYNGVKCELVLGNVHAGGNEAEMFCGGSVTLGCSEGADVVYAGANDADIHGDIDVVIASGTYGKVFGGNNKSGNIYGHINVTIDETGCWPVMIGELYACGNEAAYSVYGYTDEGPRTKEEYDDMTDEERIAAGLKDKNDNPAPYDDPTINLISFTRIGKVFGGGLGETAVVHGNPTVNVEPIKGIYAGKTPAPIYVLNDNDERVKLSDTTTLPYGITKDRNNNIVITNVVGSIGTIYGGGIAGAVYGNTTVNIGTLANNKHLKDKDNDSVKPEEVAVTITGDIFGGGNEAIVSGDTKVQIGETPTLP